MPGYQDHLLFGAILVMVFSYFIGPFLSYSYEAMAVSAAFILLASVFPDIDHKGSVVHRKLRAFLTVLAAAIPVIIAYPKPVQMLAGAVLAGGGVYMTFGLVKPKHRGITHTFRFCAAVSIIAGIVTIIAFGTVLPAIFTFIAYLSHLFLDGTLAEY